MLDQKSHPRNIELVLAYEGSAYYGWQIQPDQKTVQGVLNKKLKHILSTDKIKTIGASRTDTGVHAHDQHVGFQTTSPIPVKALHRSLNHHLPKDIRVLSAREREADFSCRYHTSGKHYAYYIVNGNMSPFVASYAWNLKPPLDVEPMDRACRLLEGTRCFKAFQAGRDHRDLSESTLHHVRAVRHGNIICIDIVGSHFFYHMIRNIVGSLVKVGRGIWSVEDFAERTEAGDRRDMGKTAPAQGLHLFKVFYGSDPQPEAASQRYCRALSQLGFHTFADNWIEPSQTISSKV